MLGSRHRHRRRHDPGKVARTAQCHTVRHSRKLLGVIWPLFVLIVAGASDSVAFFLLFPLIVSCCIALSLSSRCSCSPLQQRADLWRRLPMSNGGPIVCTHPRLLGGARVTHPLFYALAIRTHADGRCTLVTRTPFSDPFEGPLPTLTFLNARILRRTPSTRFLQVCSKVSPRISVSWHLSFAVCVRPKSIHP